MKSNLNRLMRSRVLKFAMPGALLVVVGVTSYFLGDMYAVEHMVVIRVTPAQLSDAMKSDHFYRSYRESTLLVSGQVSKVGPIQSKFTVVFAGSNSFPVSCEFLNGTTPPAIGSQISVITEAARALRLPNGVLLKDCIIP